MKIHYLFLLVLFGFSLFAQQMPKAGEISSHNFTKAELASAFNKNTPFNKQSDIINFDSSNVSFRGNFPFAESYALSSSESGNLVFIGSGGGIFVTDVTNPASPQILSEVRTRSLVDYCTYDETTKRLYVCAYFSGIEIWDLSVITNPVRMSRIPTEPYPRSGVAVSGNYLFTTTNNSLWTIDITDPYNPAVVEDLFITNSLISQMYKKDQIVFVVSDMQGIKVVDISDPLNLQIITSTAYLSGGHFDISGDYLYGIKGTAMTILDISNPVSIQFVTAFNSSGNLTDIKVNNNKAYISKYNPDGLQIIDVSVPSSPVHISNFSGDFSFITGWGNNMFLTRNSTFTVLNVANPNAVQQVYSFEFSGFVHDMAISANYLYTGSNGFRVFDMSDSTKPVQIGYADIAGQTVEPAGDSLVVYSPLSMTANNTFHIMNVANPAAPVSLDSYTCPVMTGDLVVRDRILYLTCWWDGLRIFNFNEPTNIIQLSHVLGWQQGGIPGEQWCYAQAVAVENNYLYIVDYGPFPEEDTYGLYILDITNPSSPALINRYKNLTSHPIDIVVREGILFIADGAGGVEIVDVTNPLNPVVINNVPLIDGATGISMEGDFVYVSNYILGGVQVIDISNPWTAEVVGWYKPTGCFAVGIEAKNGLIYAADGIAGFQVYRNLLAVSSVDEDIIRPEDFHLTNYPNPFNPSTQIEYLLPAAAHITLKIYNTLGQELAVLDNSYKAAGLHKIAFEASEYPSGVYFYRLETGEDVHVRKMIILK